METFSKPYPGVPASMTGKMERCVNDLMKDPDFKPIKGRNKKSSAIAVCHDSIMGKSIKPIGTFEKVRAFVVTKYFEKEGKWSIEGVASTINPDLDGEQMSKEALNQMCDQIRKSPIPLKSEHGNNWDDQIGTIYNAELDGRNLIVKAEIFKTTRGKDLMEALKNGAKLGLSVAGRVIKAGYELCESLGKKIKTFKDVILDEISVTARPANTMTWLHVMAKSINFEKGDQMAEEITPVEETEATEEQREEASEVPTEASEEVKEETEAEASPAQEEAPVEEATEEATEAPATEETATEEKTEDAPIEGEVEKAGRKLSKLTKDKILAHIEGLRSILEDDEDGPITVGGKIGKYVDKVFKSEIEKRDELIAELRSGYTALQKSVDKLMEMPLQKKAKAIIVTKKFADAKEEVEDKELSFKESYIRTTRGEEGLKAYWESKKE